MTRKNPITNSEVSETLPLVAARTAGDDDPEWSRPIHSRDSTGALRIELDGDSLSWVQMVAVLEADTVEVRLSPHARERMRATRVGALKLLADDSSIRVYGWNQALGPLKDHTLDLEDQRQFQLNVLRSHAVGIGGNLPSAIARLALIVRANVLARGTTGARPEFVDRIIDLVNAGITPLVPEIGSLGTGDLQPMAAAGLCLIGEAPLAVGTGGIRPTTELLAESGLSTEFSLEAGEAIALVSGSAVLSAYLVDAVRRAIQQLDVFIGGVGLFCEATRAELHAFDRRLHQERRISTEIFANELLLSLFEDSEWMTREGRLRMGETAPRIQDSTAVRSVSHSIGAVVKALEAATSELVHEVNASTANPLVLVGDGAYEFVSGGNWDCTMLGHSALSLNIQITNLAVLAKDLTARLGVERWSHGLPTSLTGGVVGLNSGMTLVHSDLAALIPEMHVRATPVSSLSFPLKGGQEDHNTMAMAGVRNLVANLDRFDFVLAIMLIMSAQGISLIEEDMAGLELGSGTRRYYGWIRKWIPPLHEDRSMSREIAEMAELVRAGQVPFPHLRDQLARRWERLRQRVTPP